MKKMSITRYKQLLKAGDELIRKLGFEHDDVIEYYKYLERYAKGEPFAIIGIKQLYYKHFKERI